MLPTALDRRRGSIRVAPLMPSPSQLLVGILATPQPAEAPAPQLPAGLAPSIRIHDGDTSIEVQCSVRDSIGECTDAAVRLIDRLNGAHSNTDPGPGRASDISG